METAHEQEVENKNKSEKESGTQLKKKELFWSTFLKLSWKQLSFKAV